MTARKALLPAGRMALAIALLATAGLMWSWLPTKLQSWSPIDVHGTVEQRVAGRDIAITVHKFYLAREVTAKGEHGLNRFPSKGVWLVMVLSYEPLLRPESPRFRLRADGRTFSLNLSGFGDHAVQPELPVRGLVAFEVPSAPHSATLLVTNTLVDNDYQEMIAPLDSRIAIDIPLAGVTPRALLNLDGLSHE
jgi:hypothetical protein